MSNKVHKLAISKRIRLVPFTEDYVPSIVKWAENPSNSEFFRRCAPLRNWLDPNYALAMWRGTWVIVEDSEAVGILHMSLIDQFARSAEGSILVDKASSAHPHVTAQQAYREFLDYAFDYCNLHKVYVKILDSREQLKAIAEEFGFVCEAILRDSIFYKGEYRNEYLLSCLKLEYRRP